MSNEKVLWFDVLTPKQAMLFLYIGKQMEKFGFHSHYTTRNHDYIHDIFNYHNIKPISIGGYGGSTLEGKLLESTKRVTKLAKHIVELDNRPLLNISLSSPDASRIAYGLNIPIILFNDTTHSIAVGKLTFSLAKYLITLCCIDSTEFTKLGANKDIIYSYYGVDEVEYVSGENYDSFKNKRINFKEKYLVFRPEESFAAYMDNKNQTPYVEILEKIIAQYSGRILVFPRYLKQKEIMEEKFEGNIEILEKGMYFLELLSGAEVVITGGGTMAREAALLGIPSITYFWRHLEPQSFLEKLSFPSYSVQTINEAKKLIKSICSKPQNYCKDTSELITKLEKPSDALIKIIRFDDCFQHYIERI